jgi:hypothetical protein
MFPRLFVLSVADSKGHDHVESNNGSGFYVGLFASAIHAALPLGRRSPGLAAELAAAGDMIRAVIVDWGGVLMRTEDAVPRLAWDARLDLPPGSVNRLVFESPAWQRALVGQVSEDELWGDVGARLSLPAAALAEFRRDFWAGDRRRRPATLNCAALALQDGVVS